MGITKRTRENGNERKREKRDKNKLLKTWPKRKAPRRRNRKEEKKRRQRLCVRQSQTEDEAKKKVLPTPVTYCAARDARLLSWR